MGEGFRAWGHWEVMCVLCLGNPSCWHIKLFSHRLVRSPEGLFGSPSRQQEGDVPVARRQEASQQTGGGLNTQLGTFPSARTTPCSVLAETKAPRAGLCRYAAEVGRSLGFCSASAHSADSPTLALRCPPPRKLAPLTPESVEGTAGWVTARLSLLPARMPASWYLFKVASTSLTAFQLPELCSSRLLSH